MWGREELAGCALENHDLRDFNGLLGNKGIMKKIFFIHFHEAELKEKIQPLKQAGFKVDYHFTTESVADLRQDLPDVLVIC